MFETKLDSQFGCNDPRVVVTELADQGGWNDPRVVATKRISHTPCTGLAAAGNDIFSAGFYRLLPAGKKQGGKKWQKYLQLNQC